MICQVMRFNITFYPLMLEIQNQPIYKGWIKKVHLKDFNRHICQMIDVSVSIEAAVSLVVITFQNFVFLGEEKFSKILRYAVSFQNCIYQFNNFHFSHRLVIRQVLYGTFCDSFFFYR